MVKGELVSAKPDTLSRVAQMDLDGTTPDMPPCSAPALIGYLMEIGPVETNGMGRVPIGWATIESWQRCTGIVLQPWQSRLLRRLSSDFIAEGYRAEKPDRPAPWSTRTTQEHRDAVDRKLRAAFGGH